MLTYTIVVNDNGELKTITQKEFEYNYALAQQMEHYINILLDERSAAEERKK